MSDAHYGTICQNSGCIRHAEFLSVIPTILLHDKDSDIIREKRSKLALYATMYVISEIGTDAIDPKKAGSVFLCDQAASVLVPIPADGVGAMDRKICARVVVCSHSAVHVSCPLKRKDLSISKEDMELFQTKPDQYVDLVIDSLRKMFKSSELHEYLQSANTVPENPTPSKAE